MKHAGLILCILLVLGVYGQRTDIPVWKWIQGPHSSLEWNTSASIPSPRADSGYVTSGGVMLLIGGEGLQYPNAAEPVVFTDVWALNGSSWTCVFCSVPPGSPATSSHPGARLKPSVWTHNGEPPGSFYLFGGSGTDARGRSGLMSDIWRFEPPGQWVYVGGEEANERSRYNGAITVGGRDGAASWTSGDKHFILGGFGFQRDANPDLLGDLWEWDSSQSKWVFLGGPNTNNAGGKYTTGNDACPGPRVDAAQWSDDEGRAWIFGGYGFTTSPSNTGLLHDMWFWNKTHWKWLGGTTAKNIPGNYNGPPSNGEASLAAPYPGARSRAATWIAANGLLMMFGGWGYAKNSSDLGYLSDVWAFNTTSNTWTFITGITEANVSARTEDNESVYNVTPGGRAGAAVWSTERTVYLFGGYGIDITGAESWFGDLWKLYYPGDEEPMTEPDDTNPSFESVDYPPVDESPPPATPLDVPFESPHCSSYGDCTCNTPPPSLTMICVLGSYRFISSDVTSRITLASIDPLPMDGTVDIALHNVLISCDWSVSGTLRIDYHANTGRHGRLALEGCLNMEPTAALTIHIDHNTKNRQRSHLPDTPYEIITWSPNCSRVPEFNNIRVQSARPNCAHSFEKMTSDTALLLRLFIDYDCYDEHQTDVRKAYPHIVGVSVGIGVLLFIVAAVIFVFRRNPNTWIASITASSQMQTQKPCDPTNEQESSGTDTSSAQDSIEDLNSIPLELLYKKRAPIDLKLSENVMATPSCKTPVNLVEDREATAFMRYSLPQSDAGSRATSLAESLTPDSLSMSPLSSTVEFDESLNKELPIKSFHDLLVDWASLVHLGTLQKNMFAELSIARWNKKRYFVVKSSLLSPDDVDTDIGFAFETQVAILASLPPHLNIAHLVGVSVHNGTYNLLLEYKSPIGTIQSLVGKPDTLPTPLSNLSLPNKLRILRDLASASHFLHKNDVLIYKNYTSENIIITNSLRPKIVLYGFTSFMDRKMPTDVAQWSCLRYLAPEIIRGGPPTRKSDVYSFGIVAFELLAEEQAFSSVHPYDIVTQLNNTTQGYVVEAPAWCPTAVRVLLASATAADPNQRPTFYQIRAALNTVLADQEESFGLTANSSGVQGNAEIASETIPPIRSDSSYSIFSLNDVSSDSE